MTKSKPNLENLGSSSKKSHPGLGFKIFTIVSLCVALTMSSTALALGLIAVFGDREQITVTMGTDGNSANFTEGSIAEVASKVAPAVVSIMTETRTTSWFGASSTATSAGTGMIVTSDGYILTNYHVVDGARSISVILDNGTTYKDVDYVGRDPLNDVAFLKINGASDLPTVTLGDSRTLSAGQQVIAIGNALGQYQNTITAGVISGTGRSITAASSDSGMVESLTDMIQTDAAINAGNSGGALVNAAGEVIGINTATSSNADGIGFAIPISSVKGMLKNLIATGKVERSYLGVYSINVTPDVATTYDLPVSAGAYIYARNGSAVIPGSAAEEAGLKDNDIVLSVNGVKVGVAGSLSVLLGEYAPGDTVQLVVRRGGGEKTLKVKLGAYSENKGSSSK